MKWDLMAGAGVAFALCGVHVLVWWPMADAICKTSYWWTLGAACVWFW